MKSSHRFQVLVVLIVAILAFSGIVKAQDSIESKSFSGLVVGQKKYSVEIGTAFEFLTIQVPATTPVSQQLERPTWDWQSQTIHQQPIGGEQVDVAIPTPVYIDGHFVHRAEFDRLWKKDARQVVRYQLTKTPMITSSPQSYNERLQGRIKQINEMGVAEIETTNEIISVTLGDRDATLSGFSIADLQPNETLVEVEANYEDKQWVAQSIKYRPINKMPERHLDQVRVLLLVDEGSLQLQRNLSEQLGEGYQVIHPPELIRDSEAWNRMGCWLGDFRETEYQWDIIVLGIGTNQLSKTKSEYQNVLKSWCAALERTGARKIWLPLRANDSAKAKQMEGMNEWASETMKELNIEVVLPDAQQPNGVEQELPDRIQQLIVTIKNVP